MEKNEKFSDQSLYGRSDAECDFAKIMRKARKANSPPYKFMKKQSQNQAYMCERFLIDL